MRRVCLCMLLYFFLVRIEDYSILGSSMTGVFWDWCIIVSQYPLSSCPNCLSFLFDWLIDWETELVSLYSKESIYLLFNLIRDAELMTQLHQCRLVDLNEQSKSEREESTDKGDWNEVLSAWIERHKQYYVHAILSFKMTIRWFSWPDGQIPKTSMASFEMEQREIHQCLKPQSRFN